MSTRRQFIITLPAVGAAWGVSRRAFAQAPMVDENDPAAKGIGYVADAAKADKAKFKTYAAGQTCGNCALYQAKADAPAAGCALFPGKQVAGKGWCSAYSKRA
jgi:hypothetical protein